MMVFVVGFFCLFVCFYDQAVRLSQVDNIIISRIWVSRVDDTKCLSLSTMYLHSLESLLLMCRLILTIPE